MSISFEQEARCKPVTVDEPASTITYDLDLNVGIRTLPIVEGRVGGSGIGLRVVCPYNGRTHVHPTPEGTHRAECARGPSSPWPPDYYVRPRGAKGPFVGWGVAGLTAPSAIRI